MSLGLVVVLVLVQLVRGAPLLELAQFALILTVASIPVAMPAVLSVTMAVGALALSRMKAIVSRLESIEEMAGIDILCSDKTGTLTQNKLTLGDPVPFAADSPQALILAAALASKEENADAIDLAILQGLKNRRALDAYVQTRFVPFDPGQQAHRGRDPRRRRRYLQGQQRGAAGDPGAGPRSRRRRRTGDAGHRRIRQKGLPYARRGTHGDRRYLALPRHPAAVRSAARGFPRHHRAGAGARHRGQDGDGRQRRHRPRDRRAAQPGSRHPARHRTVSRRRRKRVEPCGRGADRELGRLRPGIPRAQVRYREGAAGARPPGRA